MAFIIGLIATASLVLGKVAGADFSWWWTIVPVVIGFLITFPEAIADCIGDIFEAIFSGLSH